MKDLNDWEARPNPSRIVLEGRYTRLEPLNAQTHGDDIYNATTMEDADERFRYLPLLPPADRVVSTSWLGQMQGSEDPLFFAVIDKRSGKAEGWQTLMSIVPAQGVIEIGYIYWGGRISRTPVTTEAFYLFAKYIFDDLGYRRFEWKCNDNNIPSKNAAQRFGMTPEGVFRQHMVVKGENRNTAWFSLLDTEWPAMKQAFEAWLDPANFDAAGNQIKRLSEFRDI